MAAPFLSEDGGLKYSSGVLKAFLNSDKSPSIFISFGARVATPRTPAASLVSARVGCKPNATNAAARKAVRRFFITPKCYSPMAERQACLLSGKVLAICIPHAISLSSALHETHRSAEPSGAFIQRSCLRWARHPSLTGSREGSSRRDQREQFVPGQ